MKDKKSIIPFMFMALLALSLISLFKCDGPNTNQIEDSISDLSISDKVSDLSIRDTVSDSLVDIGTDLNKNDTFEIAFRQVSNFKIQKEFIIFYFFGVISEPLKKDDYMIIKTNLTKEDGELMEQEANCTVKEDVNPENGEQKQVDLECQVKVGNPGQFNGLEIVPSKSIIGIPSEPKLLNPALVDLLIEIGEIKNYSLPENKKETIPVFNATSLDTNDSEKTGVFYINGEIPPKFELNKNIEFELTLLTGQKVLCTIPKVKPGKKEIKIEVLQEELKGTKIMISPCAAFDGYKEIIRLKKIEAKEPKDIANGRDIKLKKKFDLDLSFGQLSGFARRTKLIFFYFDL